MESLRDYHESVRRPLVTLAKAIGSQLSYFDCMLRVTLFRAWNQNFTNSGNEGKQNANNKNNTNNSVRAVRRTSGLSVVELTLDEVIYAYECCRKNKRSALSVIEFEADFVQNILSIYHSVRECSWKPSSHMCFVVMNPKPREVWASQFSDRVVHHIMYNRLRPRFEPSWISTTFACIPERGTLAASLWAESSARKVTQGWSQPAYVLQVDIKNFFPTIGRKRLYSLLTEKCEEDWLRHLVYEVVNVDVTKNAFFPGNRSLLSLIPYHKSLWNAPEGRGLPIGNLTSQFGANVYLDHLDQRIVNESWARHYGRYVDDMVLLDASSDRLLEANEKIISTLGDIGLSLHPDKTRLSPISHGFDFCGRFIKPHRTYLRKSTSRRGTQRIKNLRNNPHPAETATSYMALARHCNAYSLRKYWAEEASKHGISVTHNYTRARKSKHANGKN